MLTDEYLLDLKLIALKSRGPASEAILEKRDAALFKAKLSEYAQDAIPLMVDELIELRKNAQRDLQTFTAYYGSRPPAVVNNYHCTVEADADDDYILVAIGEYDIREFSRTCANIKNKAGQSVCVGKLVSKDGLLFVKITVADIKKANENVELTTFDDVFEYLQKQAKKTLSTARKKSIEDTMDWLKSFEDWLRQ